MTEEFTRPRKMEAAHAAEPFDSGSPDLDDWFRQYSWVNQRAGMTNVYVSGASGRIAGFYALSAGGVAPANAAPRVVRGVPRHPVPVVVLTRLAVDREFQGRGLGKNLVSDALRRVSSAADEIGVRALLIHAKDEEAKAFYMRQAEFEPSPTDPLHLFLLMKDLRAAISG